MGKTRTLPWNMADHIETKEDVAAYLNIAFEDGDPRLLAAVLGDISRSKAMGAERKADFLNEEFFKIASDEGLHKLTDVLEGLQSIGLRLEVSAASSSVDDTQRKLNDLLQQLSPERLKVLADFAAYLANAESEAATQELLAIPGLSEQVEKNRATPEAQYVDWRTVRPDV